MINFGTITDTNSKIYKHNFPESPDHSYRILITVGSGAEKITSFLNLTNHQSDNDEIQNLSLNI